MKLNDKLKNRPTNALNEALQAQNQELESIAAEVPHLREEVSKLRVLEKCFYFILTKINADKAIQLLPISENEKNEIRQKLQSIKEVMKEKEQSKTVDYKKINKTHHTNNTKYREFEK